MMDSTFKAYKVKANMANIAEEAYRVLRANIQFCGFKEKIRTVAITSCNPGEGKSTTSLNLAASMAKIGMKVLLLEADLRKPSLAKQLGAEGAIGLTTYISGAAELDDIIRETDVKNLYFVVCGPKPPNPAELLESEQFAGLLQKVRERFDIVILDTPPLGSVIDCAIVAAQVDGVLIVVEPKAVEYRNAKRVKEQLEKANARVLGVVLNKVHKRDYRNYHTYYNYESSILTGR